jgi:hypothetical protein
MPASFGPGRTTFVSGKVLFWYRTTQALLGTPHGNCWVYHPRSTAMSKATVHITIASRGKTMLKWQQVPSHIQVVSLVFNSLTVFRACKEVSHLLGRVTDALMYNTVNSK